MMIRNTLTAALLAFALTGCALLTDARETVTEQPFRSSLLTLQRALVETRQQVQEHAYIKCREMLTMEEPDEHSHCVSRVRQGGDGCPSSACRSWYPADRIITELYEGARAIAGNGGDAEATINEAMALLDRELAVLTQLDPERAKTYGLIRLGLTVVAGAGEEN